MILYRLMWAALAGFTIGAFLFIAYDAWQSGPRWQAYIVEHDCRIFYKAGTWGPPNEPSGMELWVCNKPRYHPVIKNPHHSGVGGI